MTKTIARWSLYLRIDGDLRKNTGYHSSNSRHWRKNGMANAMHVEEIAGKGVCTWITATTPEPYAD